MYPERKCTSQMCYQECKQKTQTEWLPFLKKEMNIYVDNVLDFLPISDVKLVEIKEAQDEDPVCRQIKNYCMEGWPDKFHLNDALKPYGQSEESSP